MNPESVPDYPDAEYSAGRSEDGAPMLRSGQAWTQYEVFRPGFPDGIIRTGRSAEVRNNRYLGFKAAELHERDLCYMGKALSLAERAFDEDEVPIGCIIVYENKIIAKAYNQVEKLKDSTAHAEMIAITQAESYLQSKWLKGCSLYVTIEPCLMCADAIVLSRIDKVLFGVSEPKTGAFGSVIDINKIGLNHQVDIVSGILGGRSRELMQRFFQAKRH